MDPAHVDMRQFYPYTPNEVKHRKRTTRPQLRVLEDHYRRDTKPNAQTRRRLAAELEMTPRGVQVWFQNRRAKTKLQAKKLTSASTSTSGPSSSSSPGSSSSPSEHSPPAPGIVTFDVRSGTEEGAFALERRGSFDAALGRRESFDAGVGRAGHAREGSGSGSSASGDTATPTPTSAPPREARAEELRYDDAAASRHASFDAGAGGQYAFGRAGFDAARDGFDGSSGYDDARASFDSSSASFDASAGYGAHAHEWPRRAGRSEATPVMAFERGVRMEFSSPFAQPAPPARAEPSPFPIAPHHNHSHSQHHQNHAHPQHQHHHASQGPVQTHLPGHPSHLFVHSLSPPPAYEYDAPSPHDLLALRRPSLPLSFHAHPHAHLAAHDPLLRRASIATPYPADAHALRLGMHPLAHVAVQANARTRRAVAAAAAHAHAHAPSYLPAAPGPGPLPAPGFQFGAPRAGDARRGSVESEPGTADSASASAGAGSRFSSLASLASFSSATSWAESEDGKEPAEGRRGSWRRLTRSCPCSAQVLEMFSGLGVDGARARPPQPQPQPQQPQQQQQLAQMQRQPSLPYVHPHAQPHASPGAAPHADPSEGEALPSVKVYVTGGHHYPPSGAPAPPIRRSQSSELAHALSGPGARSAQEVCVHARAASEADVRRVPPRARLQSVPDTSSMQPLLPAGFEYADPPAPEACSAAAAASAYAYDTIKGVDAYAAAAAFEMSAGVAVYPDGYAMDVYEYANVPVAAAQAGAPSPAYEGGAVEFMNTATRNSTRRAGPALLVCPLYNGLLSSLVPHPLAPALRVPRLRVG
ncbi:hypothetical protein WOLCODRAFT_144705 [Wolfiporia cocos MD-104 SS10]|uniref:Homeobox domain-containing protein n=1 Tax=Wolfiporia cocos (strain MD-104) TaxID=742152 RepID=A0A2H3JNR5_WOLCO|nr:hypothetical protein WOLCODRAFT_144705 [Wolfiporia cocos MD-104 SS10]